MMVYVGLVQWPRRRRATLGYHGHCFLQPGPVLPFEVLPCHVAPLPPFAASAIARCRKPWSSPIRIRCCPCGFSFCCSSWPTGLLSSATVPADPRPPESAARPARALQGRWATCWRMGLNYRGPPRRRWHGVGAVRRKNHLRLGKFHCKRSWDQSPCFRLNDLWHQEVDTVGHIEGRFCSTTDTFGTTSMFFSHGLPAL